MAIRRRTVATLICAGVSLLGGTVATAANASAEQIPAPPSAAAPADLPSVLIGGIGTTDTAYTVRVGEAGQYKLLFQINYPTGTVELSSSVDGRRLPVVKVVTPTGPQRFAVFAYSAKMRLCVGDHQFVLRASRIPSTIGIRADLVDADLPEVA